MKQGLTRRGLFGLGGAGVSLGLISWPFSTKPLAPSDEILLNQSGFLPRGPKQIAIRSAGSVTRGLITFDLVESETDRLAGHATGKVVATSDKRIGTVDLSSINAQGTFYLRSGKVTSLPFRISDTPFDKAERALARAFYLQRCGVALDDPETGLAHGSCHRHDALSRKTHEPRNCIGGWHDAGDFGKYVATTSVVIGDLLSLYEEDPARFQDGGLGIPESGDGEPDLLSEMRVGLAWLMKMQRPYGTFERKVSGNDWPSMTALPDRDTQPRFAYGSSTADTAKAAAALAIAARVFEPVDRETALGFLQAAEKAWQFLGRNGQAEVDQAPGDDNGSGSYLAEDRTGANWDRQDRFWAALELYLTTGKKVYAKAVKAHASHMYVWPATWSNPSLIGLSNFLRIKTRDDIAGLRHEITKRLIERASEYEKVARLSPWGVATLDFGWGSNREIAARGRILAVAYEQTGDIKFYAAAACQADYLLGKNPFGLCFVTGSGSRSVQNPHHRLDLALRSRGADRAIPGLLVGGPNNQATDDKLGKMAGPDRYRDDAASFETNEFAIDHNAALIVLLGKLTSTRPKETQGVFSRILRWMGR